MEQKRLSKSSHGFALPIVFIIFVAVLVLGTFIFKNMKWKVMQPGPIPTHGEGKSEQGAVPTETPSVNGISSSDDPSVIEKELEMTSEGSFDADIQDLNKDASSL